MLVTKVTEKAGGGIRGGRKRDHLEGGCGRGLCSKACGVWGSLLSNSSRAPAVLSAFRLFCWARAAGAAQG